MVGANPGSSAQLTDNAPGRARTRQGPWLFLRGRGRALRVVWAIWAGAHALGHVPLLLGTKPSGLWCQLAGLWLACSPPVLGHWGNQRAPSPWRELGLAKVD